MCFLSHSVPITLGPISFSTKCRRCSEKASATLIPYCTMQMTENTNGGVLGGRKQQEGGDRGCPSTVQVAVLCLATEEMEELL